MMSLVGDSPLAAHLAAKLREAREHLVARWLERIADRVMLDPAQIFPTTDLLDHIPLLIDGLADYLADPSDEITADAPVIAKAMELGALRHSQGFEASEILKEYEILGGIVYDYLMRAAEEPGLASVAAPRELLSCGRRVFRALNVIQQATTTHFLRAAEERVHEREQRLRAFNRTLSHEIRTRVGAIRGSIDLLLDPGVVGSDEQRRQFHDIIAENVAAMQSVVENLTELSQLESDTRQHRNTRLTDAVAEVVRQLRDYAAVRSVTVRVADGMPVLEVPAAAVELAVSNYLANAIKYHDPAKRLRWAEIRARIDEARRELIIEVRDNGLGVRPEARGRLFDRYYRAAPDAADGVGLGLSIVRDVIESVGGRAWAEFPEGQTVFALAIPARRTVDRV